MSAKKDFNSGKYDFIGKAKYIIPIWLVLMILGIFAIGYKGLNYGIDFAGGTEMQVQFPNTIHSDQIRKVLTAAGFGEASVQSFGDKNEFLIRLQTVKAASDKEINDKQLLMLNKITEALNTGFQNNKAEIRRVDSVGPQVGEELKRNSILATVYSLFLILIYVGMRFDFKYAPSAVFCLLHDTIIMISIFAVFNREVNVQTLAAILTLIGYSLNDTIINFDRIRENEKIHAGQEFSAIVNRSVNDMLSRTILTSMTTQLAILALYFLSDGVIQQIAFTLGIGIVLGTYSSIYIANPLVIVMHNWLEKRHQSRMRAAKA